MNANVVALVILILTSPLGAFDVVYYHIHKFRLHARPESHAETVTHLFRGALIGLAAIFLARSEPHGLWFWAVAGLLLLDFINDIADVILEPKSRASLGGIPPFEYITHLVGAAMTGAASAAFIVLAWPWAALPTEMAPTTRVPSWLAFVGYGIGFGALVLTAVEAFLFIRATPRRTADAQLA